MAFTQNNLICVIAAILALTVVFSGLGVYDSNTMPFVQRLFFWGSTISVGAVMGIVFMPWVFTGPLAKQRVMLQLAVLSLIASAPVVLVLAAFSDGFAGAWPLQNWVQQYLLSFIIALLISTLTYINVKAAGWVDEKPEPTAGSISPSLKFLERLPIKYHGAELFAVSSEDHYLRVHTDSGEELILMRLADALKELSGIDGLQTHRSWWVARNGVADSISKNGKVSLILKTGTSIPVSRSFTKKVREANYL